MNARITLIGIQTDLMSRSEPKSIADTWALDNERFDKDVLLSAIIEKGGRFEPLYSDPDYFNDMCVYWWSKWKRTFEKWFDIWDVSYTPLENYDRHELTHEDTHDVIDNDTTYSNTKDDDYTTENLVSAYDVSTYSPHDKVIGTDDETNTGSGTNDTDADKDFDRESYIHGNIGVMYATDMIDRELRSNYFNEYNHMADIFCSEMLIRVY